MDTDVDADADGDEDEEKDENEHKDAEGTELFMSRLNPISKGQGWD